MISFELAKLAHESGIVIESRHIVTPNGYDDSMCYTGFPKFFEEDLEHVKENSDVEHYMAPSIWELLEAIMDLGWFIGMEYRGSFYEFMVRKNGNMVKFFNRDSFKEGLEEAIKVALNGILNIQ